MVKIDPIKLWEKDHFYTKVNLPVGSGSTGNWFGVSLPSPFTCSLARDLGNISIDISAYP